MSVLTPVRDYIDTLVHPSALGDAQAVSRHRAFIASRLIGSLSALAVIPVYLTLRGAPSAPEAAVFAWLVLPIMIAVFLSRTGRYEVAQGLFSLALSGLIAAVAAITGGIASFAAIGLVLVPMDAALSASRQVVLTASGLALAAAALLWALSVSDLLPAPAVTAQSLGTLAAFAVVAATLYATALALAMESLLRAGEGRVHVEEDRYRLLARNMTDVISRHGRHGALQFISPAAERLIGVPERELIGHGLFGRVHVADRPVYLKALADAAATGTAQSAEFRLRCEPRASGAAGAHSYLWIELRCHPLDDAGGPAAPSSVEVVAVMRDVTERKLQEQTLEEARAETERANAAKGRFLATMSHELRTPLNVIIGFSEMLTREEPMLLDAERRRDYAKLIHESGHHLLAVVNGILDMSKIESGKFEITPEPFALADMVAASCNLLALKADAAGIVLQRRIAPDLPEIVADRRALQQMLFNLLSNAIKFTDFGGSVTVSAIRDGEGVALAVEDTGIGIGDSDLPRLGDPFFQARASYDRRHDGTGLGLSIVKGLVALHGGRFDIRSRVGVGTAVTIRLPLDCTHADKDMAVAPDPSDRVVALTAPAQASAPARRIA